LSIRLRLTFWYFIILTTVVAVFGVVVWLLLAVVLTNQIDSRLQQTADQVLRNSNVTSDLSVLTIPSLEVFQADGLYIQVLGKDGKITGMSPNLGSYHRPLDPMPLTEGERVIRDVITVGGAHVRVLTLPLTSQGVVLGYLQVGVLMRDVDNAQKLLVFILAAAGVLSIGWSTTVVVLTIGRALRPLERITEAAMQINRADDLSRRVTVTGSLTDEVGRLAAAFNATLERLERLFNSQRRFLADVSHELRTPLTAIRGNVDLLRRMKEPDRESLDAIQTEAERMSRLVGDLLMLAQAESGNLPLARNVVELDTLLLEVYRQANILAGGKVMIVIGEEDQARASGDRDRLKQVLLNLVSNAIKYTPPGGKVTLGLACVNGWARFSVADTGVGIPPQDLPHVFDRFYRVDKSRTRPPGDGTQPGGSGLGLSIAKWIAQAHGGRLEVSSQIGKGSVFYLWLPLLETRPLDKPAPIPARPE
jgi:signal transduction histidine kinase